MMNTQPRTKLSRVSRAETLIRATLSELLEEKYFNNITVQEIAERAHLNRATFYAHFADKYELLEEMMRARYRERLSALHRQSETTVPNFIEAIALATFEHIASQECRINAELHPRLERALQDELYLFVLPASGQAAAFVVSSALMRAAIQWRANGCRQSVAEIAHRIVTVLSDGVVAPAA